MSYAIGKLDVGLRRNEQNPASERKAETMAVSSKNDPEWKSKWRVVLECQINRPQGHKKMGRTERGGLWTVVLESKCPCLPLEWYGNGSVEWGSCWGKEAHGELPERSQVLQLVVSLKVLPKLITMQGSCPLRVFFLSVLMAKFDLLSKWMWNCQDSAVVD